MDEGTGELAARSREPPTFASEAWMGQVWPVRIVVFAFDDPGSVLQVQLGSAPRPR